MKHFIRNLEKEYLVIAFLVIGVLMTIFPEAFAKIFPWVLGIGLLLRTILVIVLALHYKDTRHGPGRAILYGVMGITILILGSEATGIIGVIWAVFTLTEVAEEIDDMWKDKHVSAFRLIFAMISVALAVMLMADPFAHFVTHVRILGLEILASCFVRRADRIKARINDDPKQDRKND